MYFVDENDRISKKAEETKRKLLEMRKQAQEQFGVVFPNQNPFELRAVEEKDSLRQLDEDAQMYRKFKKTKDKVFIDFSQQGEYLLDNNSFKIFINLQSQKQIDNDRIESSCQSYRSLVNRTLKSVLSQRFDNNKCCVNKSSGKSQRTFKDRSNTVRARTITLTKKKTMGQQKVEYEKLITEQRRLLQTCHLQRFHKQKLQEQFQDVLEELNNTKKKKQETIIEQYKKKYFF